MQKKHHKRAGFTLIEILVVIGIIAVLAAVVLIAINPARQFAAANDSQRTSNVNAILNAIGHHVADNTGDLPAALAAKLVLTPPECDSEANACVISDTVAANNVALCEDLVPTYIPSLPVDPDATVGAVSGCSGTPDEYNALYTVWVDSVGRVTISAVSELDPTTPIAVTR